MITLFRMKAMLSNISSFKVDTDLESFSCLLTFFLDFLIGISINDILTFCKFADPVFYYLAQPDLNNELFFERHQYVVVAFFEGIIYMVNITPSSNVIE